MSKGPARQRSIRIEIGASAQYRKNMDLFEKIMTGKFSTTRRNPKLRIRYSYNKSKYGSRSILGFSSNFMMKHVVNRFRNIVKTWDNPPDVSDENILRVSQWDGDWEFNAYPYVEGGEVDKFRLLNRGFMRVNPVSYDFIPKTRVRSTRSFPGRGAIDLSKELDEPRPVKPREFIAAIASEVEPLFMKMALNNFKRLIDELDKYDGKAAYSVRHWGSGKQQGTPDVIDLKERYSGEQSYGGRVFGRRAERPAGTSSRAARLGDATQTARPPEEPHDNYPKKRKKMKPLANKRRAWSERG